MIPNKARPIASIVVTCFNEERFIVPLLEAIASQDTDGFEVIIVDGMSEDKTVELAQQFARLRTQIPMRVLYNPKRTIPSGLDAGIEAASGAVVIRLDAHCRPATDYVRRCCILLESSGASVVGGRWIIRPGASSRVAKAISLAVSSGLGTGGAEYRRTESVAPRDVDTVPFGCFTRNTWETVGKYDERLLANEDYEFYLRIRAHGGRIHFDPGICCEYFARSSLTGLAKQYSRYGWWRARTLKMYPHSLRVRQVLPLLWVTVLAGTLLGGMIWPSAMQVGLILVLSYVAVLACYSAALASRHGWNLWLGLIAAFCVIHFSWGSAALGSMVLKSRLPRSAG